MWGAVAVVLLIGSRSLISGALPAVGEFAPFPGATTFLELFWSGWRTSGVGSTAPAPPAFAGLGLAGMVLLGGMGLLQKLLVLGALPLGLAGAFRLARPLGSPRARLVVLIAYAAMPLPYNAIARGRWGGLVAYALAPWILAVLARVVGAEPFEPGADVSGTGAHGSGGRWRRFLSLGVLLAAACAIAPSLAVVTVVAAVGLVLGGLLSGDRLGWRAVTLVLGAAGIAFVLLAPWSIDLVLPGGGLSRITAAPIAESRALGFGALLRFNTGPVGGGPIGVAFLVAGALALLVGQGWRLAWATRCWGVAITCWTFAWVAGRGWLPIPAPTPEITLAPAGIAMALAAGLGLIAFRTDLPSYTFGFRQVASLAAGVAVGLATLPIMSAAIDGRWHLPSQDYEDQYSWMPAQRAEGAFRVLWLGDPEALPLQGWPLGKGVAYGLSDGGTPDAVALWPASDSGSTGRVADALRAARDDSDRRGSVAGWRRWPCATSS